jgi:hypothetical protein
MRMSHSQRASPSVQSSRAGRSIYSGAPRRCKPSLLILFQHRAGAVQGRIPVNTEERGYACDAAPEPQLIGGYSAAAILMVCVTGTKAALMAAASGSRSFSVWAATPSMSVLASGLRKACLICRVS